MSIIGKTLAHYEITTEIGKGGMGEVYQATDTKLGRDVAIKVLPGEFAQDADRVSRFQREAKLLASLNHPNIAAIYGLEEADGTHFLVLELVEGQTLAERVQGGPVDVEEALKLSLQIAEALEAAHDRGVIHRDLKPANIKVTPEGKVKVLDFGLAKAYAGDPENINLSNSPTLSDMATQQGLILGTAAYMSPEQARGKAVDKKTDVWAFGCVLYEMLTGKAAFQGEDVTEILAAVVKSSVNMDLLPANIHFRVREVITRCLQKEQKKRYRDIGEAQYEIEQVLADPSGVFAQSSVITKPKKKLRVSIPWVAAIAILWLIIAGLAGWLLKPAPQPEPKRVVRFEYEIPEDQQLDTSGAPLIAVSPDGSQFGYATTEGIYLRSVDQLNATLIAGTEENNEQLLFSRDGKWIAYLSNNDRQLKKISIRGGTAIPLYNIRSGFSGGSWAPNNMIVYGEWGAGCQQISPNGGNPELLLERTCVSPQILPDGKTMLFATAVGGMAPKIIIHSLETGDQRELIPGEEVRYLPTGHIIYMVENNLYALPFDQEKLEVADEPVLMVENILRENGAPQFAISDSGTLVYMPGSASYVGPQQRRLVWVDREGNEKPLTAKLANYNNLKISPDGTKVVLELESNFSRDIWIWDLAREALTTRLTRNESIDVGPQWTSDGKRIVFSSNRSGNFSIYWRSADGTGNVAQLASALGGDFPTSLSKDGKILLFDNSANHEIGILSLEEDHGRKIVFKKEEYRIGNSQISPDGKWMAYQSEESGQFEIYVRPFPNIEEAKSPISTNGGSNPRWSADGKELFYTNGEAMMVAAIETEPTFNAGIPKTLFTGVFNAPNGYSWDIHPDGDRFLMIKPASATDEESSEEAAAAEGPRKIIVVTNWFEELKKLVPVD